MKKILFLVAAMATLISCSSHGEFYFDEAENRAYNNPNAEFDSLSYAYGIEMALPLHTQLADFDYNRDLFIELAEKYLSTDAKSLPDIELINAEFAKFDMECMRPYMMAKQRRMFAHSADMELPAIYNEKYTREMFTEWMSAMASNMVVSAAAPVNVHYVLEGIKATKDLIGEQADASAVRLDSAAQATIMLHRSHIQNYYRNELPKYHLEQTGEWLAEVAKQPGVQPLAIGNDTIYYRINNAGGVKTSAPTDSIALDYRIYSYRGTLLQSTKTQMEGLEKRIMEAKANKELTDSARYAVIRQSEKIIADLKKHMAPVSTIRLEVIKHCLQYVGEFGSITIWAPTKFAPPSRMLMPNEGVVVDFEIKRIVPGAAMPAFPELPKKSTQTVRPENAPVNTGVEPAEGAKVPMKIVPAKK